MGTEIDVDYVERLIRDVAAEIATKNDTANWQSEGRKAAYEKVLDEIRDTFDALSGVFSTSYEHPENSDLRLIINVKTWDGDQEVPVAGVKVQSFAWHSRPGVFSVGHTANSAELEWHELDHFEYDAYQEEWTGAYGSVLTSLYAIVNGWNEARPVPEA